MTDTNLNLSQYPNVRTINIVPTKQMTNEKIFWLAYSATLGVGFALSTVFMIGLLLDTMSKIYK